MEIIAHRGASHDAPENTLLAARFAWTQGADAIECDVQLTLEGALAVFHDADTRRFVPRWRRRAIAQLWMDKLRILDVGAQMGFPGECVPSLPAMLAVVPSHRRIFIEVKNGPEAVPELVRCLERSRLKPAQVNIISFQLETARAAKQARPQCEVCWIVERSVASDGRKLAPPIDAVLATAKEAQLDGLDLEADWPVDPALAARVHAAGLKLYVWTVDDGAQARALAAAGVDGITTNRPAWLREELGSG